MERGEKSLSGPDSRQHVLGGKLRPPGSKQETRPSALRLKAKLPRVLMYLPWSLLARDLHRLLFQDMPGCRQQCREPEAVVMSTKELSEQRR